MGEACRIRPRPLAVVRWRDPSVRNRSALRSIRLRAQLAGHRRAIDLWRSDVVLVVRCVAVGRPALDVAFADCPCRRRMDRVDWYVARISLAAVALALARACSGGDCVDCGYCSVVWRARGWATEARA